MIVTRCPCHMPSDIQGLKAVDRPELRDKFFTDHYNVIVFSSQGERPTQDKMAKGDLDGDNYFVSWDPEMMKHLGPGSFFPPLDEDNVPVNLSEAPDD